MRTIFSAMVALSITACSTATDPVAIDALPDTADDLSRQGEVTTGDVPDATAPPTDQLETWDFQGSDWTAPEDLGYQPGAFLSPCETGADCNSGFCIQAGAGYVCTTACLEDCPNGWDCAQTSSGADIIFICVPEGRALCTPCQTNADCWPDGLSVGERCVAYGDSGAYCGRDCDLEAE